MAKEMIKQLFTPQILKMGEGMVKKGAVSLTKETDGRFEATVKDGKNYYSANIIRDFRNDSFLFGCTCEYFISSGHNCKHLAALACQLGDEKLYAKHEGKETVNDPFFDIPRLFTAIFDFDKKELATVSEEVGKEKLALKYQVTNENGNPDDWEIEAFIETRGPFFGKRKCKCRLRRNMIISLTCEGSTDKDCAMSEYGYGKFYLEPKKRHKPCIHKMALYAVLFNVMTCNDINPYTSTKAMQLFSDLDVENTKGSKVDMLPVISLRDFSMTVRVFRNGKSLICPDIGLMLDAFDWMDEYEVREDMVVDFSSDFLSDDALNVIRYCSSVTQAEKKVRFMMRKLSLENHMDHFCCVFAGTRILKQGGGELMVKDCPPELKFETEILADRGAERGVRISVMIPPVVKEGSMLYFFTDDTIHRCSFRDIYPLRVIGKYDQTEKEWKREIYDFSFEMANDFRDIVLPALRKLGRVEGNAVEEMLKRAR